jgi:hypothetical protein
VDFAKSGALQGTSCRLFSLRAEYTLREGVRQFSLSRAIPELTPASFQTILFTVPKTH